MSEIMETPSLERNNASSNLHRSLSSLSKKESLRRKGGCGALKIEQRIDISDLYEPPPVSNENDLPDDNIIDKGSHHILEAANFDVALLGRFVVNELRDLGVNVENQSSTSCSSSSRRSMSKGRKATNNLVLPANQVLELVEVKIDNIQVRLSVPHVIKLCCEFIRKEITTEGIFRKSGLASRIRNLKKRFDENETGIFESDDTVYDASSVLKQYLRELPCPLIPYEVQPVFLKCLENTDEKLAVESILLSVYLLPLPNIHILAYLMAFLNEVTKYCHLNRMGYKNLAVVMTPNIMPVDLKKSSNPKGKDLILNEKLANEAHRKVVEILILYGDYVGSVSKKLSKALNIHQSMYRNSEDELLDVELSKDGRRKKRRSGSLTRMLGFLRKVTNGKTGGSGCDTPGSVIDSSDEFGLLHTPVIKTAMSAKKRNNNEPLFASAKKKTILDAVRRHGLYGDDVNSPGLITCPSPAICLNPSPMRTDWKNTPKLITPSLLRDKKRSRSARDSERVPLAVPPGQVQNLCAPLKGSSKNKVGFGRKSGKKVALIHQQVTERLQKSGLSCSAVSIHHLTDSPKKMVSKTTCSSDRLPFIFAAAATTTSSSHDDSSIITDSGDGLYVRISSTATTDDPKNDAFLASSNSLDLGLDDTSHNSDSLLNSNNYHYHNNNDKMNCENITTDINNQISRNQNSNNNDDDNGRSQMKNELLNDSAFDNISPEMLRLTPLIKEINTLTMFAQREGGGDEDVSMSTPNPIGTSMDILSPSYGLDESHEITPQITQKKSTSKNQQQRNNNDNHNQMTKMNEMTSENLQHDVVSSPSAESIAKVDEEFKRTMKEERIINLTSEMRTGRRLSIGPNNNNSNSSNNVAVKGSLQRCASTQERKRGVSPSQRRINSFRNARHRRSLDPPPPPIRNVNSKSSSSIPIVSSSSSSSSTMVVQSPRFMSLRSPRSRPTPPPLVARSPSRCTLRRGRPNTTWAGLGPKPVSSPCRPNGNTAVGKTNPPPSSSKTVTTTSTNSIKKTTSTTSLGSVSKSPRRCASIYATTPRKTKNATTSTNNNSNGSSQGITPLMRRMSSVQELVQKLEGKTKLTKQHSSAVDFSSATTHHHHGYQLRRPTTTSTLPIGKSKDRRSLPSNSGSWEVQDNKITTTTTATTTTTPSSAKEEQIKQFKDYSSNNSGRSSGRSSVKKERMKTPPHSSSSSNLPQIPPPLPPPPPKTPHNNKTKMTTTPNQGSPWTSGTDFDFDSMSNQKMMNVCLSATKSGNNALNTAMSDRESIQVLKSKNAGKVSENVRIFNMMVKRTNIKSPGSSTTRSMIPRYTALHNSKSQLPQPPRNE